MGENSEGNIWVADTLRTNRLSELAMNKILAVNRSLQAWTKAYCKKYVSLSSLCYFKNYSSITLLNYVGLNISSPNILRFYNLIVLKITLPNSTK